jgi:Na+-transporting NADH:ubiquinone oxidoreductase subunit NqrB
VTTGLLSRVGLLRSDPRFFQIAALSSLLVYGLVLLDFDVTPARAGLILATCLATQALCQRLAGLTPYEPRSALISGLSLCLLLRTESPLLAAMAAALAVVSKFAFRVRGKHVFNPTNLAIAAVVLASGRAWVSPGQWGDSAYFAFLMACAGGLVAFWALRSDVALAFLVAWAGLLFGRALWLGDPLAIPLHQLRSGSLLLFAFFMISDPKTTPDARGCRLAFGVLVAGLAFYLQFVLYRPSGGLILALFLLSPLVPVLDRLFPGPRYAWPGAPKGTGHAHVLPVFASPALALRPGSALRSGA